MDHGYLTQRGRNYWEADPYALERVLAAQRTDTARLRTVQHLLRVDGTEGRDRYVALVTLAVDLTGRLHRPDYPAYRQHLAGERLRTAADAAHDSATACAVRHQEALAKAFRARATTGYLQALDSLQAASRKFDALGYQEPVLLGSIENVFRALRQEKERIAYFQTKRADYERQGDRAVVNYISCCLHLMVAYNEQGNYNQSISNALRALDLVNAFDRTYAIVLPARVSHMYTAWGNPVKAQQYWQRALAAGLSEFSLLDQSLLYKKQGKYQAALELSGQALRAANRQLQHTQGPSNWFSEKSQALEVRAELLVRLNQLTQAAEVLQRLRQFSDSVQALPYMEGTRYPAHESWARYYTARSDWPRAEAAWLAAYKNASRQADGLRLLRELVAFYKQRHQPDQALTYAQTAADLSDTLQARKDRYNVSYYEQQAVERRQASRIAGLRQTQALANARARRQRFWLLLALGGLALLGGGAGLLWRLNRQKQHANALLSSQKAQIEEQATRLGELDEAKNQFFANVSHELRTPLTLVLGPLDALLTNQAQALPAAAYAAVGLAHRQAQRLLELVNRILDLTKLQAGHLALQPVPTPLAALLRRVVAQFESLATQRGIALAGPGALPAELYLLLDASKVEEILTNLLINALNHTPVGGTVTVALALPAGPAHPDYALTVRDTGPGIAEAEQARVFERYYQGPQGQARGGTGLGLALSRELAHLLGGALTLASAPGHGAAFTLRFPAPQVPPPQPPASSSPLIAPGEPAALGLAEPTPAPRPAEKRPRVLVVEDQPDLREYLRTLLAPSYEVLLAEDGQAALELLAHEAPVDLVTTDAMMPRLSGTELLARLKETPAFQQLPVLMLTARADEAHRLAAFTTGVDDYLTKPFTTSELLARVRALLARHEVRRHFATLPPDEPAPGPESLDESPALAGLPVSTAASPAVADHGRRKAPPLPAAQLAAWQAKVAGHLSHEDFGPTALAGLLCLSERTLYRRLGELAGLTPAAWLRELRLDQARRLLEAGTYQSVEEVADAVGFASPRYFATRYTERFGRRPGDYQSLN